MRRNKLYSRRFSPSTAFARPERTPFRGSRRKYVWHGERFAGNHFAGERFAAACCHLSILLNPFTYVGGIGICLLLFLLANKRAVFLAQQAHQALIRQIIVWVLIAPAWLLYQWLPSWLAGVFFWPWAVLIWFWAIVWSLWKAIRCL
jgi:hypothetical protein